MPTTTSPVLPRILIVERPNRNGAFLMNHLKTCGPLLCCPAAFSIFPAHGQECPKFSEHGPGTPSQTLKLEGRLVYHDGMRKWFELKLNQARCGQNSVQLVQQQGDGQKQLEILRGCQVTSQGAIDFSPTGYYSLNLYQSIQHIEPLGTCTSKPPLPDYSGAQPDKTVHKYHVDMYVDAAPGDRPIRFRVTSENQELYPWQAYANYLLTGSSVLHGFCGKDFTIDQVFGPPQAKPWNLDGQAAFDLENAAAHGKTKMHLGYTCIRQP